MEQIQLSSLREDMQAVIAAVKRSERPVLIADNGELLVKIVPVSTAGQSWLGSMKGTGRIIGDIVSPAEDAETWEALSHRFIAATAWEHGMTLITADHRLRDAREIETV